ncbi:hypothetical protein IT575_13390 [bacterium]|nr:hypothetical protein [bacterium]
MRRLLLLLGVIGLCATRVAYAGKLPHSSELVNESIKALRSTSYVATMRFLSSLDGGDERLIEIKHLAPDLYRVQPLSGDGKRADEYFVENADELVRVYRGNYMAMPVRQFAVNDALTVKFLRDLSQTTDTAVLDGQVGERRVYILRRDPVKGRNYTITVGVDRQNYFPLYLLVTDSDGSRQVYFQMESISFVSEKQIAAKLPDSDFDLSSFDGQPQQQRVRAPGNAARMESSGALKAGAAMPAAAQPLPLFPIWLPKGYEVEAIYSLGCQLRKSSSDSGQSDAEIYHLEAYGPTGELISIFQTLALDSRDSLGKLADTPGNGGFVAVEKDGWTIAIFGDLKRETLMRVAGSLSSDRDKVLKLLRQTQRRDEILEDAGN